LSAGQYWDETARRDQIDTVPLAGYGQAGLENAASIRNILGKRGLNGMNGKKVLIYEDDPAAIDRLESALNDRNIETVLGPNPDAILDAVKAIKPDLIILSADIKHGFSACLKLKKDKTFKRIPLLMISGTTSAEIIKKHQRLPTRADAYLAKPVSNDTLSEVLNDLLPPDAKRSGRLTEREETNDLIDNMPEIDIDDLPDRTLISNRGFEAAVVNFVEDEVRDLRSTVNRLETEKSELHGKIGGLESMVRNQTDILDSGMRAMREHQETMLNTKDAARASVEDINRLIDEAVKQAVAETLSAANVNSDREKAVLERDLAEANTRLDNLQEAVGEAADMKKKIKKLEKTLEENDRRQAQMKEEIDGNSTLFARLESGYKENLELVEEERTAALDRLSESENIIDDLKHRLDELKQVEAEFPALQEAAARAEILQDEVNRLAASVASLQKRNGELESAVMVAGELKSEIEQARAAEKAARAELVDFKGRFDQVRKLLGLDS
jgi:CheY-like chemotaxis protein